MKTEINIKVKAVIGIAALLISSMVEYSCAAEPPVRGGVSHLSRRNEPL